MLRMLDGSAGPVHRVDAHRWRALRAATLIVTILAFLAAALVQAARS
jgi:hypothetical protein